MPLIHALGVIIGWCLFFIPNRLRHDSRINIGLCFPNRSPGEQAKLVRRSLIETGKTVIETGALWLRPGPRALQLVREVDGLEHVETALDKGNGVILATPHLGAWEAAGLYGAATFHMTCLYRPLRIPELEDLVLQSRNRLGANYVTTGIAGLRTLRRTLAQGGTVAMLPDQEPQAGTGIFAPYFDTPAYTMVLLARLARSSGAAVVFAWCERLARGRGYRLHFRPAPKALHCGDTARAVTSMNQAIENLIRECPAQYQWSYRRFRTRPDGKQSAYKRRP